MPRKRKGRASASMYAWADLVETALATATTLGVRVPQILKGTVTAAESRRMVAEKVAAAAEGTVAGSFATARIWSKRIGKPPASPFDVFDDVTAIAEAAMRPARRRVKSNAARLAKR